MAKNKMNTSNRMRQRKGTRKRKPKRRTVNWADPNAIRWAKTYGYREEDKG